MRRFRRLEQEEEKVVANPESLIIQKNFMDPDYDEKREKAKLEFINRTGDRRLANYVDTDNFFVESLERLLYLDHEYIENSVFEVQWVGYTNWLSKKSVRELFST